MSQSSPSINDRHYEQLSDDISLFDPVDGSALIYIGKNGNPDASEDDLNWIISKLYYSGTVVSKIVKRKGSWTNRVALFP